jgi:transposase
MGKRTYRAVDIKAVDVDKLAESLTTGRAVIAIDIAKEKQVCAIVGGDGTCAAIVKWSHPRETARFVVLCESLSERGLKVEAAMEPSGTYGDVIRSRLMDAGIDVFRIAGKRVHDAAEVFDGVPSMHDPKASMIIAKLHLEGLSERWPLGTEQERELSAMRRMLVLHQRRELQLYNHLEALLARVWPEVTELISLDAKSLLELLATYGSPAKVAANVAAARALLTRVGRSFLKAEVIEAILESARESIGVPTLNKEAALVRATATEALHARGLAKEAATAITQVAHKEISPELVKTVGPVTAATLIGCGTAPLKYASPSALEKAMGLNLREFSSGTKKGGLHITKRGDGVVRQVLYMATLRLIMNDPVVAAWYHKKVVRDGGKAKHKAIVAVMRKLARALWHVGRGEAFDATKLFDTSRLDLTLAETTKQEVAA